MSAGPWQFSIRDVASRVFHAPDSIDALLVLVLSSLLAAGDVSDAPDGYACVDGATLTASVGEAPYAADCVEVLGDGLALRTYAGQNASGDYDRGITVSAPAHTVGTYAVAASGASVSVFARTTASGAETGTTRVEARSGEIVVSEASGGRVRGTFRVSGPETSTPNGGTEAPTGRTVTVEGAFDAPE